MHAEHYWILSFRGWLAIRLIAYSVLYVQFVHTDWPMECVSERRGTRVIAAIRVQGLEDVCIS